MNVLYDYALSIRRDLHQYPEVGFELERTASVVFEELKKMGYEPTTRYGKSSVSAEVGCGEELIVVRADMDALPVQEINDLPYRSKIPGKMHACGHDSHTAVLLAVAKYLKEHEGELKRRIRFMFQPAEESSVSGAKMMLDAGILDGATEAICTHCDNTIPVGKLSLCKGDYMAACIPLTLRFLGKTSHAAFPEQGVDAVAMAVEAYGEMKKAVKEEARGGRYIWCVGRLSGGEAHNVVPDCCEMNISFRFFRKDFAERVEKRVREICDAIAEKYSGSYELDWHLSTGPVYNDVACATAFEECVHRHGIEVIPVPSRMSSEDFGWILSEVKGFIFRFGTQNESLGCTGASHTNTFMIDEEGMKSAISAFLAYLTRPLEEEKSR